MTRWTGTLLLALATGALLTGCAPDASAPTPTPSFSSDEDAFAAAEATYRAYVDALNQVDLSDPATFEPVYAWTAGEANAAARQSFSQMNADNWSVSGQSTPTLVEVLSIGGADLDVAELAVCLDVASVTLTDEDGVSMVAPDRPDVQTMLVNLVSSDTTPTLWIIESFESRQQGPKCAG